MITAEVKAKLEKALKDGTFQNPEQPKSELDIIYILTNPVYAGIDPFEASIKEEDWIKAFMGVCDQVGMELALKAMLTTLRQTYSMEEDIPDMPTYKAS